jgi:hypothetical protein
MSNPPRVLRLQGPSPPYLGRQGLFRAGPLLPAWAAPGKQHFIGVRKQEHLQSRAFACDYLLATVDAWESSSQLAEDLVSAGIAAQDSIQVDGDSVSFDYEDARIAVHADGRAKELRVVLFMEVAGHEFERTAVLRDVGALALYLLDQFGETVCRKCAGAIDDYSERMARYEFPGLCERCFIDRRKKELAKCVPAEIHQQLSRLSADFERQKERISEMTGETRARIEESTRLTTSAIDLSSAATVSVVRDRSDAIAASIADSDEATAVRQKATERRLLVPSIVAASMSAVAVILLVLDLATT